jgi:hypothetical protein
MRFSEFCKVISEQVGTPDPILADLKMFLGQEAAEFQKDPDQKPQIQMDSVVNAMQNLGHVGFSAETFAEYHNDKQSDLDNLVAALSQDTVTLATGRSRLPDEPGEFQRPPEEVVGGMARRAAGRSQ